MPVVLVPFFRLRRHLTAKWQRLVEHASYRPERHYMRGPGPKWHARHGGLALS